MGFLRGVQRFKEQKLKELRHVVDLASLDNAGLQDVFWHMFVGCS